MEKSHLDDTGTAKERGIYVYSTPIIVSVHIPYESASLWTVIYMLIKAGSEPEEARPSKRASEQRLWHSSSCAHAGS